MRLIIIIFFFSSINVLTAQSNADSLLNIWNNKTLSDTSRLKALNELGWHYYRANQFNESIKISKKGKNIARTKNLKLHESAFLETLSHSYHKLGKIDSAIFYVELSLENSVNKKEIAFKKQRFMDLGFLGSICLNDMLDFVKAHKYKQEALELSKELGDKESIALSEWSFGELYNTCKDLERSNKHLIKAKKIFNDIGHNLYEADILLNLGNNYFQLKDYANAKKCAREALKLYKLSNYDEPNITQVYIHLGYCLKQSGDLDSALIYFEKALEKAKINQFELFEQRANLGIGNVYFTKGNNSKALEYLSKVLEANIKAPDEIYDAANTLYKTYKRLGQTEKALEMHEIYVAYGDSLDAEELKNSLAIKEFKEQEAKAKEIADKKILVEKNKRLEEEKAKYVWIFTFSLVILVLIAIYFFIRNLQRKKVQYERGLLLKEIDTLKTNRTIQYMKKNKSEDPFSALNRENLENKLESKLNETDWNILQVLVETPTLSNRELAEKVYLSYDGVRSSLKRLYGMFDISSSTEKSGLRMKLIITALNHSNTEPEEG